MRSAISWRDAQREDRLALQRFICAVPEKATYDPVRRMRTHPQPWVHDVQSTIRNSTPPAKFPRFHMVGLHDSHIVATWIATFDESVRFFIVNVIARDVEHQRRGVGAAALSNCLDALRAANEARALGAVAFGAYIDPRNYASISMFERSGFEMLPNSYDGYRFLLRDIGEAP